MKIDVDTHYNGPFEYRTHILRRGTSQYDTDDETFKKVKKKQLECFDQFQFVN